MAKTGVENRIMGDLNAYSPEVSGPVSSLTLFSEAGRYHTCVVQDALGIVFSLVTAGNGISRWK